MSHVLNHYRRSQLQLGINPEVVSCLVELSNASAGGLSVLGCIETKRMRGSQSNKGHYSMVYER